MLTPANSAVAPEVLNKGNQSSRFRKNISAIAASILALSSAQAGPLTREAMTNEPYTMEANGVLSTVKGVFDLNDIRMRLSGNPDAPIYDTTGSFVFRDDGSLLMILNVDENGVQIPAFSTIFDYVESIPDTPGLYNLYTDSVVKGALYGGPGYNYTGMISYIDETGTSGIRFTEYSPTPAIPEPGTLPLMGLGLAGVAYGYSKRKKEEKAK